MRNLFQYYYQLKHRLETMIELLNQRELKAEKLKEFGKASKIYEDEDEGVF